MAYTSNLALKRRKKPYRKNSKFKLASLDTKNSRQKRAQFLNRSMDASNGPRSEYDVIYQPVNYNCFSPEPVMHRNVLATPGSMRFSINGFPFNPQMSTFQTQNFEKFNPHATMPAAEQYNEFSPQIRVKSKY